MNVINQNRGRKNTYKVISKYFASKKVMDKSCSDFKEKKKNFTGPKASQNSNAKKLKKKPIKGQKDIRTILKSKKNELIAFTKDFSNVCKKSGIDVDSEQLQLAIALSKSLQQPDLKCDAKSSQLSDLSTQERTLRIRTTLQEYGFKVPKIKIAAPRNYRQKKNRKHYKLFTITESERQQIISDRYSQVLFKNIVNSWKKDNISGFPEVQLYHIATNINYDIIKNDDIFYVEGLLQKSFNTVGCLLKDWSKIPGRPISPIICEVSDSKFNSMECTQDELDVILSGSYHPVKEIFKSKNNLISEKTKSVAVYSHDHNIMDVDEKPVEQNYNLSDKIYSNSNVDKNVQEIEHSEIIDLETLPLLTVPVLKNCTRSVSPDIFDDDVSLIIDTSRRKSDTNTQNNLCNFNKGTSNFTTQTSDFMDLTECVHVIQKNIFKEGNTVILENNLKCQLSQENNRTKRQSNDFMEMTKCVDTPALQHDCNKIQVNIDLTQNLDHDDVTVSNKKENEIVDNDNGENVDLTQSSDSNDTLPLVHISGSKKYALDDTIILNEKDFNKINSKSKQSIDVEYKERKNDVQETKEMSSETDGSHFEEYVFHLSDHSSEKCVDTQDSTDKEINDYTNEQNCKDIDLTQNSAACDKSDDNTSVESRIPLLEKSCSTNDLGKKNDVSIDYDEIFDNVSYLENQKSNDAPCELAHDVIKNNIVKDKGNILEMINDDSNSKSDENSQTFDISNEVLNYSLHNSKHELINGFNFGGLSVLDDLSNVRSFIGNKSNTVDPILKSTSSDSCLSKTDLKITKYNLCLDNDNNALRKPCLTKFNTETSLQSSNKINENTPKNSEYIIKTDQITPMLDYESMSTPDRNKELDKYGLKPFKRKRAVQLLTYLYNQTHPVVESCTNEELPSPSKKLKPGTEIPRSQASPKKNSTSPKKSPNKSNYVIESEKENDIYEISNEVPDIKDIQCNPEDWVFQKKEKSKVHSCRVPLHIAFHNYVTCRRRLMEAILRYEPVNIDVIHKQLAASGHRYDPKDLLKFMDKKCITVKTMDNNSRNRRY